MLAVRRMILLLVILSSMLVSNPRPTLACSCMIAASPTDALADATAVFVGKVIGLDLADNASESELDIPIRVTLQTSRIWKGSSRIRLVVYTAYSGASCGYNFQLGQAYLVYAHGRENDLQVSLCSLTKPLANADADLQALGNGQSVLAEGANFGIPLTVCTMILLSAVIAITIVARLARYRPDEANKSAFRRTWRK